MAGARRELLLRVHRHRLRWEDLEDCYGQATLELLAHVRRGGRFKSAAHLANVVEQRFVSRVHDRRRALAGRSPMQAALESAVALEGAEEVPLEIVDRRADVECQAILREELRRVSTLIGELSADQRMVLGSQIAGDMSCAEFCRISGWSAEKYRKVAQRGRARLRHLALLDEGSVQPVEETSEQGGRDSPVRTHPPPHRKVPGNAGSRSNGRQHGEAHPRVGGRNAGISPLRDPAARVDAEAVRRCC